VEVVWLKKMFREMWWLSEVEARNMLKHVDVVLRIVVNTTLRRYRSILGC
jgi:hypothetical protein